MPCGKIVGEEEFSIISDYLGTPTHAYDHEGILVWERELDVYGSLRKGDNEFVPFLYQGQYVDGETGLAYNRFRYYDNESGNYLSQDPIGLDGGPRLYGYVYNLNIWIDPYGLSAQGGGYGSVRRKNRGLGGEVNHMPANSASQAGNSGISKYRGPGTMMDEIDHFDTASWGSRTTAEQWRSVQENLIRNNKFGKAMEMDIRDVKRKFGSKYNQGMMEMVDYAIEKDFISGKEGRRLKRKYLHH